MFAPLGIRDFRLLFLGMFVGQALMPLQFVAQIMWVQESAALDVRIVLVGLIAAVRGAGMITFGLYGGALADRFDRRALLIVTQSSVLVLNLLVALVMIVGRSHTLGLVAFYALTFVASALAAVDAPTRQAIVPDILGRRLTAGGIALNSAAGQIALPVSMFAAGFMIDAFGPGVAYLVGSVGHVAQVLALVLMRYRTRVRRSVSAESGLRRTVSDVREGLAYTYNHPVVLWVIVLIVAMMGLGFPAVANLGPTWITTVVGVPVREFGYVAVTWGAGAFLASMALTRFSLVERKGLAVALGTLGFALSFVIFSIRHTVPFAMVGNFGLGVSMTTAQVSGATLIQLLVPNEVRGRVMSVLNLNMGLAQLVTLPLAAVGQLVSLQVLFPTLAFTLLATIALILIARPAIWRARILQSELDEPRDGPLTRERPGVPRKV
ncbi:MAG: MFS transporter [Myxococcota bacterium]